LRFLIDVTIIAVSFHLFLKGCFGYLVQRSLRGGFFPCSPILN